jgi:phenylacetate-CoA ligase
VLHVIESSYFAEVIDPATGSSIQQGETGELVLTTLGRVGSPLLRYRTGDLVKLGTRDLEPGPCCACGRFDLAFEGGILGRTDDMIVVRGVNVYPAAVEAIICAKGGVAEYRVEIDTRHSLTELCVQIEPDPDCKDPIVLVKELETDFQTAFALRVPVTVVAAGTLPRFEMKAQRWIRAGK